MPITKEDLKRLKFYRIEKTNPFSCGVRVKRSDNKQFPFAFEANYRITKIRASEFAKSIGVSLGAVQGWVRRGLIDSESVNRERWLDMDSVIDFIEEGAHITIGQEELFVERLTFVYLALTETMNEDLEKALAMCTKVI